MPEQEQRSNPETTKALAEALQLFQEVSKIHIDGKRFHNPISHQDIVFHEQTPDLRSCNLLLSRNRTDRYQEAVFIHQSFAQKSRRVTEIYLKDATVDQDLETTSETGDYINFDFEKEIAFAVINMKRVEVNSKEFKDLFHKLKTRSLGFSHLVKADLHNDSGTNLNLVK